MGESTSTGYYRKWTMGVLYGIFLALLLSLVWVPWTGYILVMDTSANIHEVSVPGDRSPIWASPEDYSDELDRECSRAGLSCFVHVEVDWVRHFISAWIPVVAFGLISGPIWAAIRQPS